MTIAEMSERVHRIKEGFVPEVLKCMDENRHELTFAVREQLYSGIDGRGAPLSPSYSQDPWFRNKRAGFFDEEADHWVPCFMHPERYIAWKQRITPPEPSNELGLPARAVDTPNLFIVGVFHGSISAKPTPRGVEIFTFGWDQGPAVERKYGSQIFALSEPGVAYFNQNFLLPWLKNWLLNL